MVADHGRVFVETDVEAADTLAELHGVASFSPCRRCRLGALEAAVLAFSDEALSGKRSFAVRVKRAGTHPFTSAETAHRLGGAVQARHSQLRVDLRSPEAVIGVAIRVDDFYLFYLDVPRLRLR